MSLRKIYFAVGEYYHIYNRGNSKQNIFHDPDDYGRFLKLMFLSNGKENFNVRSIGNKIYNFNRGKQLVDIGAYCLMPNHFHILLTQTNNGDVSKFIHKLLTGYSMYYNKKYERVGALFEGKFKSEHANNDRYLKYLFSYIHLNPVKLIDTDWKEAGIKDKRKIIKFLEQFIYSSFQDYLGVKRPQKVILNTKAFPNYFSSPNQFRNEIFDWVDYK